MEQKIYDKLTNYCAYQERTISDVRKKLHALKVDKNDWKAYVDKLMEENFLDEKRFTKSFVKAHLRKKWGKAKMKAGLMRKGIPAGIIKQHLDEIPDEHYEDQINTLVQKKWKTIRAVTLRERKNKLTRFLLSKGFEMSKIIPAVKDLA